MSNELEAVFASAELFKQRSWESALAGELQRLEAEVSVVAAQRDLAKMEYVRASVEEARLRTQTRQIAPARVESSESSMVVDATAPAAERPLKTATATVELVRTSTLPTTSGAPV